MRKTVLIMAGGRGERFWPRSRKTLPKQFLNLTDDEKTMIQLTVERVSTLISCDDIFIVTNIQYRQLVEEQVPNIPKENIICEPIGKNTAPCIGLGAVTIRKKYQDALMIVLPADHLIRYNELFLETLKKACDLAVDDNRLVTIGIIPEQPETGYGYVKYKPSNKIGDAYPVEKFVEKPDWKTAISYIRSEEYFWNSGMFIWKCSSILNNIKKFLPDLYKGLVKIEDSIGNRNEKQIIEDEYKKFCSESIDYGIMEKTSNIYVLPGVFGWDDVGTWLSLERINKKDVNDNVINDNTIAINSKNNIVYGKKELIAMVGVENMIVVDTEDVILICNKNQVGNIQKVIDIIYDREQWNLL